MSLTSEYRRRSPDNFQKARRYSSLAGKLQRFRGEVQHCIRNRQSKEKRDFRNFTVNIFVYSREIKIYVKIDFKILSSLTWINFVHNNSFVDAYIFSVAR